VRDVKFKSYTLQKKIKMHDTDKFKHWNVTLQSGKEVYVISPEACVDTIALRCANDWVRNIYPVYDNDKAVKVVGFNDRFVYKGLSVERRLSKCWHRIDTTPISDDAMQQLVQELYKILSTCYDNFGEDELSEYIKGTDARSDIEKERDRLEKELLLEYGGVQF
jgi:hypothetical protein